MLTNKEIRALPMPRITHETKMLALQNADHNVFVVTSGKIKSNIVINVFSKNEDGRVSLFYRYFIKKHDARLYNIRTNKITDGYLTNVLQYRDTITAAKKEAEKLKRYISPNSTGSSAQGMLYKYDTWRSDIRCKLRKDKKCAEIDGIMRKIKKVPKSFETTVQKTMSHSNYIFFDRKNNLGTCSCCGSTLKLSELPRFKDREFGKCPKCGKDIQFKSEIRRQYCGIRDEGMAVLVQKYADHVLAVRYFHILYDYKKLPVPKVTVREVIRTIIDYNKQSICDYEWYYYNGTMRWCLPQNSMFNPDGFHHIFLKGILHKKGLSKELRVAGMDKLLQGWEQINQFIKADSAKSCYVRVKYLEYLAATPVLEQITKCGFYNLVSDYMSGKKYSMISLLNEKETSIIKILGLKNRVQLREARSLNINSSELDSIQTYNKTTDVNRSVSDILRLARDYEGREERVFALPDSRLRKLSKYLDGMGCKKYERHNLITDYFDYMRSCEILHYDMTSDIVLYPKDFKKAHDEAAVNVKSRKLAEECSMIAGLLPDMHKKYDFSSGTLLIKAPDSGRDIICEGQALHHCVGNYIPQVADGSTVILFIRRKSAPDKPYVTVEVKNDKVVQIRGFDNKVPESDVVDFVEQFKHSKCIV